MSSITTDSGYEVATRVRAEKQWLVRSGESVVGPVSLELLERGLAAQKIPADAEMAHVHGHEWRRVAEIYPSQLPAPLRLLTPIPPCPEPDITYLDDPISIPRHGIMAALFG